MKRQCYANHIWNLEQHEYRIWAWKRSCCAHWSSPWGFKNCKTLASPCPIWFLNEATSNLTKLRNLRNIFLFLGRGKLVIFCTCSHLATTVSSMDTCFLVIKGEIAINWSSRSLRSRSQWANSRRGNRKLCAHSKITFKKVPFLRALHSSGSAKTQTLALNKHSYGHVDH